VQLDANDAQAHYQLGLAHLQLTAEHRDRGRSLIYARPFALCIEACNWMPRT
jgi:hypothetical protein